MAEKSQSIEEIKKKYKDEWVLINVLKTDELNRPIEGELLAHSKNKDDTYKVIKNLKEKPQHTAHFYTGELPKDYAIAFSLP